MKMYFCIVGSRCFAYDFFKWHDKNKLNQLWVLKSCSEKLMLLNKQLNNRNLDLFKVFSLSDNYSLAQRWATSLVDGLDLV